MKTRLSTLALSSLAAVLPAMTWGQELIPQGAEWRYLKGTQAPPAAWNTRTFNDAAWAAGQAGIGYGDGDDATTLDDMMEDPPDQPGYWTVYLRRRFNADPGEVTSLVLRVRYDDGFVAYVNGVEAARRAMGDGGSAVDFETPAAETHEAAGFEAVDISTSIPRLVNGENVLAVEVHNRALDSSDLTFDPLLAANEPASCGPYPPGFCVETFIGGFSSPTGIAFANDGRLFVAEKRGMVWVVKDGARLPDPFIDLSGEVNNAGDRGLLGIELDASFATNGRVYFLYVVDPTPGGGDEPGDSITFGRLTRYTADGDQADPGSRRVLLGNSAADGFIHCHSSHAIGSVKSAFDGTLFVGAGDGAHFDFIDGGQDVSSFDPGCETTFGGDDDIGALRSQRLDSFAGKILRINADTGLGLSTNPFWNGDAASVRSRVWVSGLRNPFRFTVRPDSLGTGTLYIGDVGLGTWEEMNVARGGENFGWPCFEGQLPQNGYQNGAFTQPTCQTVSAAAVTQPLVAWHHSNAGALGFIGNCASGACFYTGTTYPRRYWGSLFFADYGQNWIRVLDVDDEDQLLAIEDFATDLNRPVNIEEDPATKDLFYVSVASGEIRRIVYTVGNRAPLVSAVAEPATGAAPLAVQFSSAGTLDPDGDPLTYSWDFDDGSPAVTSPNPLHTYTASGTFSATLTVRDDRGGETSRAVTVETSGGSPEVSIVSPAASARFYGGEQYTLRADATDPEDGSIAGREWAVVLHHDEHTHPDWFVSDEAEPVFTAQSHGDDNESFYYEVTVTVRDTDGLTATAAMNLFPGKLVRGDGNADGTIDISDGVLGLNFLFAGQPASCVLALDVDATGVLEITDAIRILNYLFRSGPQPEAPFPDCGTARNQSALACLGTDCAP